MTATSIDPPTSDLVAIAVSGSTAQLRLTATGEIDSSSAPLLRKHLDAVLEGDVCELVVDLSGVTFLDSAGLCVLAAAHRHAVAQGVRLRVIAASRAVIRPLQITGLFDLLGVEQVESDAGSAA